MTMIMVDEASLRMKTCDTESHSECTRKDLTLGRITVVLNIIETIKSKH